MKRVTRLRIKEISAVTSPAQEHARAVILKRATLADHLKRIALQAVDAVEPELAKLDLQSAASFNQVYDLREAESKRWQAQEELWGAFSALQDSIGSIVADKSLTRAEKTARIEESVNQFIAAITDKLPEVEAELTEAVKLNADVAKLKEPDMTPQEIEALKKKAADAEAATAEANKRAERAEKVAKLSAEARKHFDALKGDEADAFLAKSDDEQKAIVAKAAEAEETLEVAGRTIKKSVVGADQFAMFKAQAEENAATRAALAKAENDRELAAFEKTAEGTDYSSLPGSPADKAAALRAVEKISDEKARETVKAMLKGGNAALAEAAKSKGRDNVGTEQTGGGAEAKLKAKAEEIRKAHPTLTPEAAYSKAMSENPKLYAEYNAEQAARAARVNAAAAA